MTDPYDLQRRDPAPVGRAGEVALCVVVGVLLVVVFAALAGLGVASAVFGGGWVWPHGTEQIRNALGGLLNGHPGRGLPAHAAARVSGRTAVYAVVAACEVMAAVLIIIAVTWSARWCRPGDPRRGMAARREVRKVLGAQRVRRARRLIRPDLFPPAEEGR
jgi:hypothetical protein